MATVTILIPHHHGKSHLKPLFRSLMAMERGDHEALIVLVDNASADGSVEYTAKRFPQVKIWTLPENRGFAPALNQAAHAFESDWLIFLNNDTRVATDWLTQLMGAVERLRATCLSSHLMDWQGKRTQFGGGWINLGGKGFESSELEYETSPYEVFFPCGCGMCVRRDLFIDAGGFDDDYFMIYEDVDLGWRLRLFGHSIYLVPGAKVFHRGHASLTRVDYARKAVYLERNSLATLYKNLDEANLARIFPLVQQEALLRARALTGWGLPFRSSSDGVAVLDGVAAFWERLHQWREKRLDTQKRRRIADNVLFHRFFPRPTQTWAYSEEHYRRIAHASIKTRHQELWNRIRALATGGRS